MRDHDEKQALRRRIAELESELETYRSRAAEYREAHESLRQSEEVFRTIAEHIREVLFLRDAVSNRMLFVNPAFEEIWGMKRSTFDDDPAAFIRAVVPEDRPEVMAKVRAQREGHFFRGEYRIVDGNGHLRWIFARTFPVRDHSGNVVRVVGIAEDITARKNTEAQSERQKGQLEALVSQRTEALEYLLRELHHRVKNNLQLVSSMIYLQSQQVTGDAAKGALAASRNRIHSMAQLHDMLYRSPHQGTVDLAEYLGSISSMLAMSFDDRRCIELLHDLEKVTVSIDVAVPCGLIVNELVTNALKHGFSSKKRGTLELSSRRLDSGWIEIVVGDDGQGMDTDAAATRGSLGFRLVRALVDQLDGALDIASSQGTRCTLRFRPTGGAEQRSAPLGPGTA